MSTASALPFPAIILFPAPNPRKITHGSLFTVKPPLRLRLPRTLTVHCAGKSPTPLDSEMAVDCVGTGADVESCTSETDELLRQPAKSGVESFKIGAGEKAEPAGAGQAQRALDWALLISPFFFWGTAMVAMKEVIPKTGPFFVSAVRLIPAGALLVAFAAARGRRQPTGALAWLSIVLFGAIDAACFQGFLAEGLQRTSAGLGSVIIDSQPLTVSILAAVLFGESIGALGASGLVLGVIGLLLLELTAFYVGIMVEKIHRIPMRYMPNPEILNCSEKKVPALSFEESSSTIWGSGEWWMLLAAQSMAIGTVMVRWVSKYSDPVMATGWHMVIGGLPLLVIAVLNHDPAVSGSLKELTSSDILALGYTSIFGSAISYGVYFYNATRGSLTKLSSLTFLTPMFASIFGFLYLGETFSPVQLAGALVTLIAIYMVNYRDTVDEV